MKLITLKYRIKDSASKTKLERFAFSVNQVWNYCNEASLKALTYNNKWLSGFDLNKLTTGTSKELNILSSTIQSVCEEYATKRSQFKKRKLNWRSSKKSLGWIPFKSGGIKYLGQGKVKYNGIVFKFWESRPVGIIRMGSFNQDSKGNWYVNLVCIDESSDLPKNNNSVGVDLGLKTTATYSDGSKFEGLRPYSKYQDKLAMAQRAGKNKQVKNISRKIANIRKDSIHKETTRLVNEYDLIVVGDVSSKKLAKTKMAKSTLDNSWGIYKSLLAYKTIRFGKEMKVVKENWTTVTCSGCFEKTFPKKSGLSSLSVREWTCSKCGCQHDRDVNASKNILRIGHDSLNKGILRL